MFSSPTLSIFIFKLWHFFIYPAGFQHDKQYVGSTELQRSKTAFCFQKAICVYEAAFIANSFWQGLSSVFLEDWLLKPPLIT